MVSLSPIFTISLATLLAAVFAFLGGLHVYWAMGGRKWILAAIPEVEGKPTIMPGKGITLAVAIGLFAFGTLAFLLVFPPEIKLPLESIGWVVAGIFLLRAIGEFKYVGFFKRVRHTAFGRRDTRLYSPLCFFISLTFVLLLIF